MCVGRGTAYRPCLLRVRAVSCIHARSAAGRGGTSRRAGPGDASVGVDDEPRQAQTSVAGRQAGARRHLRAGRGGPITRSGRSNEPRARVAVERGGAGRRRPEGCDDTSRSAGAFAVRVVVAFAALLAIALLPLLLEFATRRLRHGVRRRSWEEVPTEPVDEPIAAVKRARVRLAPDGHAATLTGLTFGGRYDAEARARCPRRCDVPDPGCDCGFYAVRPDVEGRLLGPPDHRATWDPSVRLDVELTGEVLEYELGYRAEEQRVLRVGVPHNCVPCARFERVREAVALAPVPSVLQDPYRSMPALPEGSGEWPLIEPVCEDHRDLRAGRPSIGLVELAGHLGTEVGWDPVGAPVR